MEINIENIKAAYETATESEKRLLSNLFPDLSLGKSEDVTERIKTLTDAMLELGGEHPLVNEYHWHICEDMSPDLRAYFELRIICAALNEGWEPQFTEIEKRWLPYHNLYTESALREKPDEWKANHHLIMLGDKYQSEYTSLVYEDSAWIPTYTLSDFGSRICLKTKKLAEYCGKQFIDLWADYLLTPKTCCHD